MPAITKQPSGSHKPGQAHSLQLALRQLQDLKITEAQVTRTAFESQGSIHIEVMESGKPRFFVYESKTLSEILPGNDLAVPLASKLANTDFATQYDIISYRPGRRIVLAPLHEKQDMIFKGYKRNRGLRAVEFQKIAQATCRESGLRIPELRQFEIQDECLVMERLAGQAPGITPESVDTWFHIGACLRRFQQCEVDPELAEFSHLNELSVLDERARRFRLCMPGLPAHWTSGRNQLEQAASELPSVVLRMAHRDLHDGQFMIDGKSIGLLDFDLLCSADVALDAGNLLAHIRLRAFQAGQTNDSSAVSACSQAFLRGLGRQGEHDFNRRLQFYQATTYYRLALLYAIRPRWAHLTSGLMAAGRRCIEAFNEG